MIAAYSILAVTALLDRVSVEVQQQQAEAQMGSSEQEVSIPVLAQYYMVDMGLARRQEQGLLVMLVPPLIPACYNRLDS